LIIYVYMNVVFFRNPECQEEANPLYTWMFVEVIVFYTCIVVGVGMMFWLFKAMASATKEVDYKSC
jgi:uncharacterized membrane protein